MSSIKLQKCQKLIHFAHFKIVITLLFTFTLYLITLPSITALLIPCLNFHPGATYTYAQCNILRALDQYLFLSLVGFAVLVLGVFFVVRPKKMKLIGILASILAIQIIIAYHLYIPRAETAIKNAPLFLDSLK